MTTEKRKVPVIAFEGINRVGKGTQIEMLQSELKKLGLETVVLRGDGTRDGKGKNSGDPYDARWVARAESLRKDGTESGWNEAALVLMQEYIDWKKKLADLSNQVILLDRSLISRGSFVLQKTPEFVGVLEIEHLYPTNPSGAISIAQILPDIIFELVAPKDVVLSRLDNTDPKYEFRKRVISDTYDVFYKTKVRLPDIVKERIVSLDSTRPIDEVFDDIIFHLDGILETK